MSFHPYQVLPHSKRSYSVFRRCVQSKHTCRVTDNEAGKVGACREGAQRICRIFFFNRFESFGVNLENSLEGRHTWKDTFTRWRVKAQRGPDLPQRSWARRLLCGKDNSPPHKPLPDIPNSRHASAVLITRRLSMIAGDPRLQRMAIYGRSTEDAGRRELRSIGAFI